MSDVLAEIFKLSPAERIQLAEDLWDSVAAGDGDLPRLTDEERAEIEHRLADHLRDPSSAVEWQDVRTRLWSQRG